MNGENNATVRDFQILFDAGTLGGLSDGLLLARFVARREEAVFEAIVQRHGRMVWGVCRRVLRDHHDAEDAFQATFLVLARKAASVAIREKLGNWLYGVAYQTAMKARTTRAKRRQRESQAPDVPEPMAAPNEHPDRLTEVLDQVLSRLPEKYRIPIVLCELEGKSHREASELLGWPVGTVSSRLSRARSMLASRLSRQGVTLSVGALAVLLAQGSASASMPTRLIGSTAQAASLSAAGGATTAGMVSAGVTALTAEVLKMMLLTKIKDVGLVLLAMTLSGAGLIWIASSGSAVGQTSAESKTAAEAEDPAEKDEDRLQGVWTLVKLEQVNHQPSEDEKRGWKSGRFTITIRGDKLTFDADKSFMYFKLDPSQSPKLMTVVTPDGPDRGRTVPAIYRLDGDDLMICQGRTGDTQPPAEFSVANRRPGTFPTLWVLQRRPRPQEVERRDDPTHEQPQAQKPQDAPAAPPPGERSFGGGPNQTSYVRLGNLFFVTSPVGDKFSIYSAETKKASTIKLPGTVETPLAVVPVLSGDQLICLSFQGKAGANPPRIDTIYAFHRADFKWYTQTLKEPLPKSPTPIVGYWVAAYTTGRYIYVFSSKARKWDVLELPKEASSTARQSVRPNTVEIEHDGQLHVFSDKTGEWKHTDVRAEIDAAIKAAEDEEK